MVLVHETSTTAKTNAGTYHLEHEWNHFRSSERVLAVLTPSQEHSGLKSDQIGMFRLHKKLHIGRHR